MVVVEDKILIPIKELTTTYGFVRAQLDKKCSEHRAGRSLSYASEKVYDPILKAKVTAIAFDSIPEATRTAKGIPTRDSLLQLHQQQQLTSLVAFNDDAYNYFLQRPETYNTAKEKAEQSAWLLAIAKVKPTEARQLGYSSKDDLYTAAIALMQQRQWHAWKCTSLKSLSAKLSPFQKYLKGKHTFLEACASLISGKHGNSNAGKLETDQHALLVQLYSDANAKPNYEQVWSIYTRKANEMVRLGHWSDKVLVDANTVRAYLSKPEVMQMYWEARHGHQEYRSKFEPITHRQRPTYANALWVIDGTPSHRYFQHGEKGRYFRFNIFPVLDAHSWCVLGFWLSERENTEAVLGALRSACMVTGHMPHQILYDNSSAIQSFRAQDAIDKISVVSFAAKAGNARSKIIENFFHRFNEDVQKFRPGYTANPFALTLNNRPNREALAQMVKSHELAKAEDALKQAIEDLTIWNNTKRPFLGGKSPLQAYRDSVKLTEKKQRIFSDVIDIEAFYTLRGANKQKQVFDQGKKKLVSVFEPQTYEFTNKGIEIVFNGKRVFYNVEDADFRRLYIGARFAVRHEPNPERWTDPQMPDEMLLYLNGAPLQWRGAHAVAKLDVKVPMAVADYTEGTRAEINHRLDNKKRQRTATQQNFKELIELNKRNGNHTDVITANAFDKEVLQDALSQLNNQLIGGEDYKLTDEQKEPEDKKPKDLDRLSNYDKPLPLD